LWGVPERLLLDLCEKRPDLFAAELLKAPLVQIPLTFGELCPCCRSGYFTGNKLIIL